MFYVAGWRPAAFILPKTWESGVGAVAVVGIGGRLLGGESKSDLLGSKVAARKIPWPQQFPKRSRRPYF